VSRMTMEHLLVPLPDLDGYVHGVVSLDPPKVQCDGCGLVATGIGMGAALLIILCGITSNTSLYGHGDDRRLCADCRKVVWS